MLIFYFHLFFGFKDLSEGTLTNLEDDLVLAYIVTVRVGIVLIWGLITCHLIGRLSF